ncbi:MAG: tyrosine-type recombinase/integrase [Silvanigrellaceae bacterium]|nr:tyrosine-type recombinase/integrase [Silvanigrellaceae bacterium]
MTKRFQHKVYQGKKRVFHAVPGTQGIRRIFNWDEEKKEYRAPTFGKMFDARRWELLPNGGRKRVTKLFATLDEARAWQRKLEQPSILLIEQTKDENKGPHFSEVYKSFYDKKISKLSEGTRSNYERYIRLHFQNVWNVPIKNITPQFIDHWLDSMRSALPKGHQTLQRVNFKHELSVMRSVLKFYDEYFDDPEFKFPLKARHAEDAFIKKSVPKHKDFTVDEFWRFHAELSKSLHGPMLAALATVQFFQALRISEVAALFFEDLNLNFRQPRESTLRVCRHVIYPRKKAQKPYIEAGFKNAKGGASSVKELPLFHEAFSALKGVFKVGAKGLVFVSPTNESFTYRQIQCAYDDAFIAAGLPYRSTHVLRHGGCRNAYNATGDLAIAQQLLGNTDLGSTLVYAKREKGALKKHVNSEWDKTYFELALETSGDKK